MKSKFNFENLIPFMGLIVIALFFTIATKGRIWTGQNLLSILDAALPLIVGGLGMIFVVAQGSCDMSQGSLLALSGTIGALAANKFGVAALFPTVIIIGILVGLLNGVILSKFKVSSLTITLAMLIALRALVNVVSQGKAIAVPAAVISLNNEGIKIPICIIFIVIFIYLFQYTKLGYYSKVIGENEVVGNYTGINVNKMKIIAFVFSGVMASIVGAFTLGRIGGVDPGMGNFFELEVMLALFVGGVPVTGGMQSRIYKLLIGAPTIALLENGLVLCGIRAEFSEGIEGLVLILIVIITLRSYSKAPSHKKSSKAA